MKNISFSRPRGLQIESPSYVLKTAALHGLPIFILLVLFICGLLSEGSQQFSLLARSFLKGHTYFLEQIGGVGQDPVLYHGHVYWDQGPFPAISLMPFVAIFNVFGKLFYQGYIKWVYFIGIMYFIYSLAKKFKYEFEGRLFMVYAFVLGSVFMGVESVSSSWLFAQVLCTFLLFWIIFEYFNKKRYWVIGLLSAAVLMTRYSAAPIALIPLLSILLDRIGIKIKIRQMVSLLVPVFIAAIILMSYNYARFGSPLQNGNKYQEISSISKLSRYLGVISLKHIPSNLYYMILSPPNVVLANSSSWSLKAPYVSNSVLGMSIFITSPFLLSFFFFKKNTYTKDVVLLLSAAALSFIMVLLYYGLGAQQMGYRYSLDFMPELFVAFMILYKKANPRVSFGMKFLIALLALTNFYFLCSFLNNS